MSLRHINIVIYMIFRIGVVMHGDRANVIKVFGRKRLPGFFFEGFVYFVTQMIQIRQIVKYRRDLFAEFIQIVREIMVESEMADRCSLWTQ